MTSRNKPRGKEHLLRYCIIIVSNIARRQTRLFSNRWMKIISYSITIFIRARVVINFKKQYLGSINVFLEPFNHKRNITCMKSLITSRARCRNAFN
ncbi:hypothetical protein PUN28_004539 [Cardiocondyla obscurior]|uniref:Ribosomal protein L20 n=1 Tax=Cardiocondyla obscurior TaxID=286306 RepID=A0AAW2GD74_9HYME